ncbi:uncharacterized protein LOC117295682 [Asterias rubens]|uniref:uncharacterized protein LOC117295682 n=1 Tax=Asterias rubens TaxID=7604 RepID=UPI001454E8B5|nr:uncharacterized protein LOC117295682 [Asterias rubens]
MFNITDKTGHVVVLLFLVWMTRRHVQAEIGVDTRPKDAAVHEGENVIFECDLRNVDGYTIIWAYDQSGSGSTLTYLTRDRSDYEGSDQASSEVMERISIVGDVDEEEFSLRIENVQESDSGEYSCRYNPAVGGHPTTAGMATLVVLVPPTLDSLVCRVDTHTGTGNAVGDRVDLFCSTSGGNPLPNITITKEEEIIADGSQIKSVTHPYTLIAEDNGVTFTCTMSTPALDVPRTCSVMPLVILPTVTISPLSSTVVEEGASITLDCNAGGVPSVIVTWEVYTTDPREALALDTYSLSNEGHTLYMQAMETIVAYCVASVPSGLSSNSTVRIDVTPREETNTEEINTRAWTMNPKQPSSSSLHVTIIIVVAGVLVVGFIILILLIKRQQKKKRKSMIPIDPKVGYKMREIEDDEAGRRNGTKSNDEEIGGRDAGNVIPEKFPHVPAGGSATRLDGPETEKGRPSPSSTPRGGAVDSPQDMSVIYAQPQKKPKHPKHLEVGSHENMYSTVADGEEEPVASDSGLLYADLDLDKHGGSDKENETQPEGIHSNEQTVYASIRT